MSHSKKPPKLPVQQLVILAICRFAEPIALTSIFPYLPEMIQSFDVPEKDVAFWAGLCSAAFSIAQCFTAIAWGRASDRYGRKYVILLGLLNTMIMSLVWGFSTSLPMALAARVIQGAGNGNVGIIRTMVAELCPAKELQPRAFSIMPLVYNIGAVLGPAFGGLLSNPLRKDPYDHSRRPNLFWMFPYSLPNMISAACFFVGITTGVLFLRETLAAKKDDHDVGLEIGKRLTACVKQCWSGARGAESEPLLSTQVPSSVAKDEQEVDDPVPKATYREILTRQTTLNLTVYTLLSAHSIAFDQLLPVFLAYPRSGPDTGETRLPFKFSRGFGIDSASIGMMFTCYGFMGIFWQFVVFPPVVKRFGALACLRVVLIAMPITYVVAPFSTLIPDVRAAQMMLFAIWTVKGLCSTFAFPCSTILLTNSAPSLAVLGTINGLATSVSAIGRAVGPAVGGAVFSWGVVEGYIVAPFIAMAIMGALAPVAAIWLVEGEGFGDESQYEDDEAEESEPQHRQSATNARPLLSRTTSLARTISYGDSIVSQVVSEESDLVDGRDAIVGSAPSGARSLSRQTSRRSNSGAVGMGQGFRRASSNLGQTRSGYGGGGGLDAFTRT